MSNPFRPTYPPVCTAILSCRSVVAPDTDVNFGMLQIRQCGMRDALLPWQVSRMGDRWNRKKQGRSPDASRQVARSTPLYITLCFLVSRHVTVARAQSKLAKMCRLASILQLENRWTELYEIWYWLFSLKLIEIKMTKLLDIIHRFFIKTQRFWMKARSELPALTCFV
jgi:hypothetical protein